MSEMTEALMTTASQARRRALELALKAEMIADGEHTRDVRGASPKELAQAQVYAALSGTWATLFVGLQQREMEYFPKYPRQADAAAEQSDG